MGLTIKDRYRGYALLAQSLVPINSTTIVYGTNDSGISLFNTQPKLATKIESASRQLNLKVGLCFIS